jgi:L-arabinose isomerase
MITSPTQEIWFVTGSQGLYGEETLRQVASQSRAMRAEDIPADGPGGTRTRSA